MENWIKITGFFVAAAILSAPFEIAAQERDTRPEETSTKEVLAYAPFRSGNGSIEIVRVTEEGDAAIGIKREGKIGDEYRPRPEWARLPISEQTALAFADLTGRELPDKAVKALLELEVARRKTVAPNALMIVADVSKGGGKPLCPVTYPFGDGDAFVIDCIVRNGIYKQASKPDDVCLLTAAIEGNHTQEISYKAVNNQFYETHESNVYEGHYVAYQHLTSTYRTRSGHIFNATNDKSRFNFSGDMVLGWNPVDDLVFGGWGYSDCVLVTN